MDTTGPKYTDCGGFILPFSFSRDAFHSALAFSPKDDTVVICTYPKCGTTWMQNIVYLLMNSGQAFPSDLTVDDEIPHLESRGGEYCANYSILITHLPTQLLKLNQHAKYIYIVRNPKDCCVSFYHHTRGFVKHYAYAHGTFDDFYERFINGKVDFGDYFDHFRSWEPYLNNQNLFFCTYEQLKCDTKGIVEKLAAFLGIQMNDQLLESVLQNCSFQSMTKDNQRWSSERPKNMPSFIRKGEIGDWRNHFSSQQSDRMIKKIDQFSLMKILWSEHI